MQGMNWEEVAQSYDKIVGKEGHYYHKQVIVPKLLKACSFQEGDALLDLGCGQGFFQEYLPKAVDYVGVDASPSLINLAKRRKGKWILHDLTKPLALPERFTHVTCILSLQNIGSIDVVIKSAYDHLHKNGRIFLILNHPCFRIPRQSSWGIDEAKKIQYRRVDRYLTPLTIPIQMTPGKGESTITESHHAPISTYINALSHAGFGISRLEEWISDKQSEGRLAKMENRRRQEFPLFMMIEGYVRDLRTH